MKNKLFKTKTHGELFEKLFHYWCGRFSVDHVPSKKDNRCNCHAMIEDDKILIYNSRKLGGWQTALLINGVFHEIHHYMYKLPYNTEKQQIESEYLAELFAVKMMKQHYPEYAKESSILHYNKLHTDKWIKQWPIHYTAFSKIKEYK